MRNLLVIPRRGDEIGLYGTLLANALRAGETYDALLVFAGGLALGPDAWRTAIAGWGIEQVTMLNLPPLPDPEAADRIRPHLAGYARIFVPDPCDRDLNLVVTAALAALAHDGDLWCRTASGAPNLVSTLDGTGLARLLQVLNRHYGDALAEVDPRQLGGSAAFRAVPAAAVARYAAQFEPRLAGAVALLAAVAATDPDPWGLAASPYEAARHALELDTLRGLDWHDLVEVGACRGTFTTKLAAAFPERRIVAVEFDPSFAATLRGLGLSNVEAVERSATELDTASDVVLCSSCLYYLPQWPERLIAAARRFVVTSHFPRFERERVEPAMRDLGWSCRLERALPSRLELFEGFPLRRDGTLVRVWERLP